MRQEIVNDIRDRAVKSCKDISCESILLSSELTYRRLGNQLYCFCPYCDREKFLIDLKEARLGVKNRTFSSADVPDHLSINTRKNMFFCFSCSKGGFSGRKSAGGGSAKLYSYLHQIPYIDAALMLALSVGAITEEEFKESSSSEDAINKFKKGMEALETFDSAVAMKEAEVKTTSNICNLVYSALLSMPELQLTVEHRDYLLQNRYLSLEEIKRMNFFTYSKRFSIDALVQKIQRVVPEFTYNHLYGVPGFFFESTGNNMGRWHFKSPMPHCLGIPLRNYKGEIVALQMRNMELGAKSKYFYISSKYESSKNKNYGYGSSPSTPVAVCYPTFLQLPTFYVGEGIFKMMEVAKEGVVAFSVQGVNSLAYVADEIKKTMQGQRIRRLPTSLTGIQKSKIVIVFDADMYSKIQVLEASLRAEQHFSEQFQGKEIYFLLWKEEYGKGFDDMKFNLLSNNIDYHQKVRPVPKEAFISIVKEAITVSDQEYMSMHPEMELSARQTKEYGNILYKNLYINRISKMLP